MTFKKLLYKSTILEYRKNKRTFFLNEEVFNNSRLGLEPSAEINNIREKINEYREKLKAEKIIQWDQNPDILKDISFEKASSNISLTKTKFKKSIIFFN